MSAHCLDSPCAAAATATRHSGPRLPQCSGRLSGSRRHLRRCHVAAQKQELGDRPAPESPEQQQRSSAETTEKFGLEAGLWQIFRNKNPTSGKSRGEEAKDLLKRYGSAYLITSISFAIVSFAACYALVSAGVDVAALLSRVGLQATDTSERVGSAALAYAAHKALSPVRFPPTVALTPVVARFLGKEGGKGREGNGTAGSEAPDGK